MGYYLEVGREGYGLLIFIFFKKMLFKTVSFKEHPLNREDMICYIFCISLEFIFSMREIKLKYVDVTCSTIITKKKKKMEK